MCKLKFKNYLWIFILSSITSVVCQERQHFRATPKDQDVIEGGIAVIKCEVGNQGGRVQWAKDGFVLGFNRTIPGYPRYEMIGTGDDGTHHLKILNATLVDDAAYQCQVSPSDGHPPIRATGRLNVLMPPTNIELMGKRQAAMLEVKEGSEITLTCVVENSKPVADISWLKNEKALKIDGRSDEVVESRFVRRHNVVSKIKVKLSAKDDGSRYSCKASHRALTKPLISVARISVLYPPGPPVITGYTDGETIKAGEERLLTCMSKGGNPMGDVLWYRNGAVIDNTSRPRKGFSVNLYRFIVDARDNSATFSCEVKSHLLQRPLKSSIKLSVLFPPEKVIVSGPKLARPGDNVTLTCSVENSNPPSSVSWVVDGKPSVSARARNERASAGGWHTVSVLAMRVPQVDRNLMFTCHATNSALGKTSVDTYMLSVLRPPKSPEIYGYSNGMGIRVGEEQTIKCVSRGGNPPASVQWYRNGDKIPSQKSVVAEASSAEITILAEPRDNGARLACEAFNDADPTPKRVSTTLIVYFPPDKVSVKIHPTKLKAGGQSSITCEAGHSNPPAEISWYRGDFKMNGHLQEVEKTPDKGTSVTNVLLLNLTSVDDGLTYTCKAVNSALQTETKDSITLHVTYPPEFKEIPPEVVDIKIGESKTVNLTATGNPLPIHYSWSRLGVPISKAVIGEARTSYRHQTGVAFGSRVLADGPLLRLSNVTVADAGEYNLEAGNTEGITTAAVKINVLYPAFITATSKVTTVSSGDQASLICEAEGNPLKGDMIRWHRSDYDFSVATKTFRGNKAVLEFAKVNRNDTGFFTCIVNNGVGNEARANATLIVKSKPQINKAMMIERAAAKISSTGRLTCHADGAPPVTFRWKKNGVQIPMDGMDGKFINESFKTGLVSYGSTLEIRRVDYRDYGHYSCVAKNAMGTTTFSIHFTSPTKPDSPLALKVVNTSHDSVTLHWSPGFDGGLPQYFRVRYRPKSRKLYEFADVVEEDVRSYTVTGLDLDTEYFFSIMSRNEVGHSDYIGEYVRALTLDESPPTPVPSSNVGREETPALPALWVVIVVLVATALLVLNVSAIVCIVRRRRRKRGAGGGAGKEGKKFAGKPLPAKTLSGLPTAIPLGGLSAATGHHRKGAASDQISSKSTTNTMYAPSSYNDTIVGETLSSISEKSRESSYNQEDSVGEYEDQEQKHGHSYLIDQIDPPPEYASQTPSSQPSSANYDPNDDDYADVLRRNAYNHQLGKATIQRPQSRATHYSTSPESRGYVSYSYTPSPTVPNGVMHYRGGSGYPHCAEIQVPEDHQLPFTLTDVDGQMCSIQTRGLDASYSPGAMQTLAIDQNMRTLGLDGNLPLPLGLEQHSIPSEHPSLTLDPNSITVDHPIVSINELPKNGDIRSHHTPLTTFNPSSSPTNFQSTELQGHLV